jgi:predicted nucleic acid-binding protein
MRIYLDVSCLSRPFDDQSQERVRIEAEAVRLILARCERGDWELTASEMVVIEINANPDRDKRRMTATLLSARVGIIELDQATFTRAAELEKQGLGAADAVHVAVAELHGADVLLTCDDRLLRRVKRGKVRAVRVENPVDWLREQDDA